MQTRKYPRTMQEAFGPYTDNRIAEEADRPLDWQDRIVIQACVVCAFALIVVVML